MLKTAMANIVGSYKIVWPSSAIYFGSEVIIDNQNSRDTYSSNLQEIEIPQIKINKRIQGQQKHSRINPAE